MSTFELHDPLFLPHHGCELSFSVQSGEVLVIWGENGIGKSTLLRRFYCQSFGQSVSLLEQKPLDYFYDRSLQSIFDFFKSQKLPGFQAQWMQSLLNRFHLDDRMDRSMSQLSGGEAQMLKLILALCCDRDLYLLDEPSQFLDSSRKQVLASYLEELRASGKKILMVEHDLSWLRPQWRQLKLEVMEGTLRGRS